MSVILKADVSLNGGSIDATVYEDTDQDGVADNSETVALNDGSDSYSLSTLNGGTGNDYWLDFSLSTTDVTASPVVRSATVDPEPPGPQELKTVATLNGGSIDATVYEDTDQDGVADNSETVSVSGGTSTASLSSLEGGSGNDYWIQFDFSTTDVTASPELEYAAYNSDSVTYGGQVVATASPGGATVPTGSSIAGGQVLGTASPQGAEVPAHLSGGQVAATATPQGSLILGEVSGTVTLDGASVQGATVLVVDPTDSQLLAKETTDSNGQYKTLVEMDQEIHVAVQYEDSNGNQYNDESKPFIVV